MDSKEYTLLSYSIIEGEASEGLVLPSGVKLRSLTTLCVKLIKNGAKVCARYGVFQMAEVAIPLGPFRAILERIRRLRLPGAVWR